MKQLGLATLNYENANKTLPPGHWWEKTTTPKPGGGIPTITETEHSTISYLLSYLEETALADQWDFNQTWNHSDPSQAFDNERLSKTYIAGVRCPTVTEPRLEWPGATDYTICEQINNAGGNALQQLITQGLVVPRPNSIGNYQSMLCPHTRDSLNGVDRKPTNLRRPKLSDTTDGTSQSFMWFETGGRPLKYVEGVPQMGLGGPVMTQGGFSWAQFENWHDVHNRCGTSMMNCNNNEEIYSFHVGGCFFTMGDGAVRFVEDSVDPDVFVSLFTRDADDLIDADALK